MPNTRETVKALISAFNVRNYFSNTIETNFTLQSEGKKDCIVVSFDKGMHKYQCSRYLDSIKRKIIRRFYGIEKSNDAEILDIAKLIFDVNSFPFDISKGDWSWDKQHGFKFETPIDQGVIFNLKSHLAFSLKKDVQKDILIDITAKTFNKKKYLWCGEFDNKGLRKEFESKFLSRIKERYENVPKNPLKVEGNSVYIRKVFDDARFIDSVTRYITWLEGMNLEVNSSSNYRVKLLKDMIIRLLYQLTGIEVDGFICASPLDREEASILLPLVLDDGRKWTLTNEEALKLNCAFNYAVFNDLYGRTQGELLVDGENGIYGINFSNKEISHCVITKIIESSVINKDHELSIDPELHFRALSPPRTPPNQRDRDSGIGESPPKPKDSVAHSSSGDPGPSTELSDMEWESSTRSQNVALKDSLRRGSKELLLLPADPLDVPGTSREFPPRSHLSYTAVSQGVSGTSKGGNLGAAAASGSIPGPSLWSQSEPSSSKGANKSGSAWTSAWNPHPLPPLPPLISSSGSVSGSRLPVSFTSTRGPGSSPPPLISSSGGIVPRFRPLTQVSSSGPSSWKGANPVGANPWAQRTNPCLSQGTSGDKWQPLQFTEPGFSGSLWAQSSSELSSWKGASERRTKDSGYSSGFVTDAEKVNSNDEPMDYQASSHVQQQNPWSDDEGSSSESSRSSSNSSPESDGENTGGTQQKRKYQSPGGSPKRTSGSGSSNSSSEEAGDSPCSNFSDPELLCTGLHRANLGRK